MASIFENSMYDSAYDESHVQERREPRAAHSVSSSDRGLCRPRQSGSGDRQLRWCPRSGQARFPARRPSGGSGTTALRSVRSAEALPLWLHQPDQVIAPAGAGSRSQSGTDLAVEDPEARLSDDRQLPQGELGGLEGREPQFCAAAARTRPDRRTLVAVDGALFHGNASKDSIFTHGKLTKQIAQLDQEIETYGQLSTPTMRQRPSNAPTVRGMATRAAAAMSATK